MGADSNSIPELLELLVRVAADSENPSESSILADLRVASADIDGPDGLCFSVALRRATISLDLSGLDIVPTSRYGEPRKSNQIAVEQRHSTERTAHGEISVQTQASAGPTPSASAGFSGSAGIGAKSASSTSASETTQYLRVKARGNAMWEVSEPSGPNSGLLDGSYLVNEVLCKTSPQRGANSMTVLLTATAKQKDIALAVTNGGARFAFRTNNHEKMLRVLISKALASSGGKYSGVVTLSKSEVSLED